MKAEEFIKSLAQLMDTEAELNLQTKLNEIKEWDSLSVVSFISFCNMKLNRLVNAEEVNAAETVEDLLKIAEEA